MQKMIKIILFLSLIYCSLCNQDLHANWMCKSQSKTDEGVGSTITVRYVDKFLPTNCILHPNEGGMVNGKYFWEFSFSKKFNKTGAFVGATTDEHLKPLFALKGLFYGGNLISGVSAVRLGFGPRIIGGDKIGILLDITNETLQMYVFHNDEPLGLAFSIADHFPTPLYPAISAWYKCEVTITKRNDIPAIINRKLSVATGLAGYWIFDTVLSNGSVISDRKWKGYYLEITQMSTTVYKLQFKIRNKIEAELIMTEGNEWSIRPTTLTASTLKKQSLARKVESFVRVFLANFMTLSFDERRLSLIAKNGDKIEFRRGVKGLPQPVTENPFRH